MIERFVTPNDKGIMGENDSQSIQNAVNYASKEGIKVVIPRKNFRTNDAEWIITESILLPSHITVVLDNCYIKQGVGAFCNVFRNSNAGTASSRTLAGEQCDIKILGQGYPILDGVQTNYFFEGGNWELDFSHEDGDKKLFGLRINSLIFMHNVKDFVIENIEVRNQRWHALYFLYCRNGRISDITSMAKNNIPNQDGINLRQGCNNIIIERMYGQTGDDMVALTTIEGDDYNFLVEGKSADIYDIKIKDVMGCSVINGVVVLRNQDDYKMYNVDIENVIESDLEDRNNIPYVALGIGQNGYFRTKESVIGNTKNINVKTVISDNAATVQFGATLCDSSLKNIRCLGNRYALLSFGVKMKDVDIDQVYIENRPYQMPMRMAMPYSGRPLEFDLYERSGDYLDNVKVTNLINEFGELKIGLKSSNKNDITINGEKYDDAN